MKKGMHQDQHRRVFDDWLKNHKGLFFKVIRSYSNTPEDQDDLFQEISIQVWNSIPNFKGESTVSTWIYRVALYTAMAWSRKQRKHSNDKQSFDETEHTLVGKAGVENNRLDWLYRQIGQLNKIDRSLALLLLDGYSYKEMSSIIGISESNVGVKINRIKKYLVQQSQELE